MATDCGSNVDSRSRGNVEIELARGRDDGLAAAAVAVVACLGLLGLGVEMVAQFGGQHALDQLLLELAGQTGFAENGVGILVLDLGQQLVDSSSEKRSRAFGFLGFFAALIGVVMVFPFRYHLMTFSTQKI